LNIRNLNVINVTYDKTTIFLSVEKEEKMDFKYLNLFDMGQKIKVDSIDNSLRLIKQGNSGSAIQMISYLIGDTPMPNTRKTDMKNIGKYIAKLNESQQQAFVKAIDGSPVTLIKGPPGTGKTHVINAISQYITKELKEKVVISSQTHVAIDNVLDKLMENHDIIVPNRITNRRNKYSGNEIDKTLYNTWGKKFARHNELASNKNFAKKILADAEKFHGDERIRFSENMDIADYSVIGATTTTSAIAGKKGIDLLKEYQWLIIDEVSKCPITEVLRYLPYIERVIMVGDDYQLSPLLEFRKEDVEHLPSYNEDMYERLEDMYQKSVFADTIDKARDSGRLVELNINYRSVPDVLNAYNIFYNYKLVSERMNINSDKVEFKERMDYLNKNDIAFVYVKGGAESRIHGGTSRYNVEEANATKFMLTKLIENTKDPHKVTVSAIFPYGAQIQLFTKENRDLINKAKKIFSTFDVDTVDAFQGKESDIVLVNTVIVDSNKRNFLEDFRRINVSMSRAKDKLLIFGNANTLSRLDMNVYDGTRRKYFKDILKEIRQNGLIMNYTSEGGIEIESDSKNKAKIKKAKQ
jgi:superfamily I DNA and/or RNA helicase